MTDENGTTAVREQAVHRRLMRFGEHESLATPMWEERNTSVESIATYLSSLWDAGMRSEDGDQLVREKGLPHARASVLNLIVVVVDDDAADRVVRTLMGLGVRHPSRAIVLVPQPGHGDEPMDARISTHCNEVHGAEDRVCFTAAEDSTPVAIDVDGISAGELGRGDRLTATVRPEAGQVVRLSRGEYAKRSRVKLSLLDLPLRPDQLLELIPPELRRNV